MYLELIFNVALILLLAYFFYLSGDYVGQRISSDFFGPKGFPQLLIVLAILILVYLTVQLIRRNFIRLKESAAQVSDTRGYLRLLVSFVILTGYVFLFERLGYIVSTFLFILLLPTAFGYKVSIKLVAFSLVLTLVMVLCFGTLFSTPLPRGFGLLREWSYLLY
jgi:putative tricarboxylic transport membrane protein